MVSEQVLGTRGAHWGGLGEVTPVGTKDQANHQENLRWPSWIRKRPAIARCPWLANSSSSCFSEHAGIPPSFCQFVSEDLGECQRRLHLLEGLCLGA